MKTVKTDGGVNLMISATGKSAVEIKDQEPPKGGTPARFEWIRRDAIVPSKTNPRKSFDQAKLEELASSIRVQGIVQPLLVRPVKGKTLTPVPSPSGRGELREVKYELVAGERRWRGAGIVKLEEVPCLVREMTDAQVLEVQYIENLQRDDLTALEEAEGFRKLIDEGLYTAESLAAKLGKSRSHIFGRLKLCKLSGPVRKALEKGEIDPTIGALIGGVASAEAQKELLDHATDEWERPSFRDLKETIERDYQRNLSGAPWKWDDAELVKKAGPCATCPKRSGNLPGHKGSPNVCTDLECYDGKMGAWGEQLQKEAAANGQVVLDAEQWRRMRHEYEVLDSMCHGTTGESKPWRGLVGKLPEDIKPAVAVTGDGVKEVLPAHVARRLAKENGAKFYGSSSGGSSDSWRKQQAAARKKAVLEEKIWAAVTGEVVVKCEGRKPTLAFWRLLAGTLADDAWNDGIDRIAKRRGLSEKMSESRPAMTNAVASMTEQQCIGFLLEVLVLRGIRGSWGLDKPQKEALAMFGVSEAKIATRVKAELAAKKKPAKDAKGTKGKKITNLKSQISKGKGRK